VVKIGKAIRKILSLKGFTIIELMIVISIITIISSIGYATFKSSQDKGRDAKRKQDLRAISAALVSYYQDNSAYPPACNPTPCSGSAQYTSDGTWLPELIPAYIQELPKDPHQVGHRFDELLAFLKEKLNFVKPAYAANNSVSLWVINDINQSGTRDSGEDFTSFNSSIATITVNGSPVSVGSNGRTSSFSWAEGSSRTITVTTGSGWTGTLWRDQPFGGGCTTQVKSYSSPNFTANHTVDGTSTCFNYTIYLGIYQPPPPPTYPSYPTYPTYPGYPAYPTYPTYPSYPTYPAYPSYPSYPTYPGYPSYPTYPTYPTYSGPPPGLPGDCFGANDVYCYLVSQDRQSFILWAQLDNPNDSEAVGQSNSKCTYQSPGSNTRWNFCVESPK
jgi:prepilin-type N-terminal cleavage/methylation domain-containing protein